MRRLSIRHLTEYRFPGHVTLGPHRLLLRPREGHDLRIESSRLNITPEHELRWHSDVFDNSVAVVGFLEAASVLSVCSELVIQHYDEAPLDFLVEDHALNYPFDYAAEERLELTPFLQPLHPAEQAGLYDWLHGLGLAAPRMQTYVLLDRLNRAIAQGLSYRMREEPGVQTPAQTLGEGAGSCRDFAALLLEACRWFGLAARFVSGYLHAPATEFGNAATHAWAEVYLPGAGWKGFDPTLGELADHRHIPVAVARDPEAVPPVAGSYTAPAGQVPSLVVDVKVSELAG